jgi:hypothetical protein
MITVLDELPRSGTGRIPFKPRPLLRSLAELANSANGVRLLGRKGYITLPVFAFGWPPPNWLRCTWPARRWMRRGAATSPVGAVESPCCSP